MIIANNRPAIIEDEPPHEFYASLVGTATITERERATSSTFLSNAESTTSRSRLTLPSYRVPVVVSEGDDCSTRQKHPPDDDCSSEFSKVYYRALQSVSSHNKLSSLSLGKSNKGYKMMENMGWKEEEGGLGRTRQGTLLPIKTIHKTDQKGLGSGKRLEARITHYLHQNETNDKHYASLEGKGKGTKAERKRLARNKVEVDRLRDKRARMILRSDVPAEYEDLYKSLF